MADGPNGDAGVTVLMQCARDKDLAALQGLRDSESHAMELLWKSHVSCQLYPY